MTQLLRALLEMRQAVPLSWSPDGSTLLVASNLPGTHQLYSVPGMAQLTSLDEPVTGQFLPDGRILVEMDEGGNERTQLYLLGGDLEPLVVDARFIHATPHVTPGGTLLAYATNRRNGSDFDIVARDLGSGEERTFELGGYCGVESVSPDGRWIVVERTGERSADNDLFLIDVESGSLDSLRKDLQAAESVGGQPVLVLTGKGEATRDHGGMPKKTLVFADLAQASRHFIAHA